MKKILLVSLVSIFAVIFILPVFAGSEDSLQVQVSTPLVSISLSEDTVSFGTLALGAEAEASTVPVVENNGSVTVDVGMRGTNATHGAYSWALDDVANGSDRYMLIVSKGGDWTAPLKLSTAYKDFQESLSKTAGQNFHIKILMPETTLAYGEYTANIYVLATQSP